MQRREFLAASAVAMVATVSSRAADADKSSGNRQLLELRTYHFASAEKRQAFEQFVGGTAIAAFNRAGVTPVGAFKLLAKDNPTLKLDGDSTDLYVLLPHNSMESLLGLEARLAADSEFQKSGQAMLDAPQKDPAFTRYDSTLLLAMEGFPRVQVPTKAENRILQLRTYESHTADKHRNKVEMFNKGEFGVFQRAGMPGVFFGGAIVGQNLPQLTYMVAHADADGVNKAWDAFRGDPEWKVLSGEAQYKGNVSKIVNLLVRPVAGSQI